MKEAIKFCQENKKWLTWVLAGLILSVMFVVALLSSRGAFGDPGDSAIVDEVAHIPSGYSYDAYHDYRLNPEHPPFAKALAAVPLLFEKDLHGLKNDASWNGINQWNAGWHFLYHAGNDPKKILDATRLPMMLLMIALGLFLFFWAKEKFGRKIALIVLVLFAFYPDILAHGRLVTTDVAAAFGFTVALYFFDKAFQKNTWRYLIFAALAFALAQLLKFSALLLFGVFLILPVVWAILYRKTEKGFWPSLWRRLKQYFWICLLSVIAVWIAYIPFVWNTPPSIEHQLIETNLTNDPRTLPLRNFEHKLENHVVTRALDHYLLGGMLVIGRVEGGNKVYILGHLSDKSISWFFPAAYVLKTPIPIIILLLFSITMIFVAWPKEKEKKWFLAVLLTPILVYWAITLKGQLNIGIRHLMPTIPFVLMLIGYTLAPYFNSKPNRWIQIGTYVLLGYLIVSVMNYYPGFIGYFNEFTPKDVRYERMIDSSLDWGQDLLRLKKYVDDNNIKSIKVDYFGGSVPSYYIPQAKEWHAQNGPTSGWIAVSATFYQSSKLVGREEGKWSYDWLDAYKPVAQIGGSILVFDITPQELQKNPPISPYPITSGPTAVSIFSEQNF